MLYPWHWFMKYKAVVFQDSNEFSTHSTSPPVQAQTKTDTDCHLGVIFQFSSVQSLRPVWLCATPRTAARQASLSITNSWSLHKLMSIESVTPSNHLILCRPLLLPPSVFPSIRVFSNDSLLHIGWPKDWSFSFSISPSNEYSGLISFRIDRLDSIQSKECSGVFSNSIVQKHQFFGTQLSLWPNSHIHTWPLEKP